MEINEKHFFIIYYVLLTKFIRTRNNLINILNNLSSLITKKIENCLSISVNDFFSF